MKEEKEGNWFFPSKYQGKESPGMIPTLFVSSSSFPSLQQGKSEKEVRDSVIGNLSTVHSSMKKEMISKGRKEEIRRKDRKGN